MNCSTTAHRTRLPGVRLLTVLAIAVLVLLPSAGRAATAGDAGETDPRGVWPLQPAPTVVRGFDPPASAWGSGHRGVDLAGAVGEAVHAALAGAVTFAGALAGRGVVVVDHGVTRTTYEPVVPSVRVGEKVRSGDVIGTLALAMSHCLPSACLHWGLIRNVDDVYLDPLSLIGLGAPVRLLPLWRAAPLARPTVPATTTPVPYAAEVPPILGWLR